MPAASEVIKFLEEAAPPGLAAEWDNTGLLLGNRIAEVTRVMTCLTVTPETAAEAIEAAAQLIVTHHPILFRAVKRLTADSREGEMLLGLVRAGVSVYSPHTAFDDAAGGINEQLGEKLGLADLRPLRPRESNREFKVVVFVPESDLAAVSDAIFAAGAGNIGNYSQCSFRVAGTGTFFGSEETNPTVGSKGRREEVQEWQLEAVCPQSSLHRVIQAIRKAHSYEEPAFDIYPLHPGTSRTGQGRIGVLAQPVRLAELARTAKEQLKARQIQLVGDPGRLVKSVAIACGAGGEFLTDAIRVAAEVLLTGEMRFHDYLAARAEGLSLLLPGHYATERLGVEHLAARIQAKWPAIHSWASRKETDPAGWI
jgi:dinuclear metal center YbgI/SA1388 family protein